MSRMARTAPWTVLATELAKRGRSVSGRPYRDRVDDKDDGPDGPRARYADLVMELAGEAGVTVPQGGSGFGRSALRFHGKIFAMLVRGDLVFKLPSARVDELVGGGGGKRFDPRHDGREMKEWIVVPLSARDRVKLARQAFEFVSAGGA